MISKYYLVLSILFVNIKFIQQFLLILAGSTDHRAREPPTHDTIVCPICGTIFFARDVFKIHVSNCSPKKMTTGLHGDLFSSNADDEISYIGNKKVLKGMEKKFIKQQHKQEQNCWKSSKMVDSGRKTVELRGVISKRSDIGTAMVVTRARTLIVIISYSLGSQTKSILEKIGHAKLVGLQVKRFMFE